MCPFHSVGFRSRDSRQGQSNQICYYIDVMCPEIKSVFSVGLLLSEPVYMGTSCFQKCSWPHQRLSELFNQWEVGLVTLVAFRINGIITKHFHRSSFKKNLLIEEKLQLWNIIRKPFVRNSNDAALGKLYSHQFWSHHKRYFQFCDITT
jgi:hypothetical protein